MFFPDFGDSFCFSLSVQLSAFPFHIKHSKLCIVDTVNFGVWLATVRSPDCQMTNFNGRTHCQNLAVRVNPMRHCPAHTALQSQTVSRDNGGLQKEPDCPSCSPRNPPLSQETVCDCKAVCAGQWRASGQSPACNMSGLLFFFSPALLFFRLSKKLPSVMLCM